MLAGSSPARATNYKVVTMLTGTLGNYDETPATPPYVPPMTNVARLPAISSPSPDSADIKLIQEEVIHASKLFPVGSKVMINAPNCPYKYGIVLNYTVVKNLVWFGNKDLRVVKVAYYDYEWKHSLGDGHWATKHLILVKFKEKKQETPALLDLATMSDNQKNFLINNAIEEAVQGGFVSGTKVRFGTYSNIENRMNYTNAIIECLVSKVEDCHFFGSTPAVLKLAVADNNWQVSHNSLYVFKRVADVTKITA